MLNDEKSSQLGMPFGTANARLRKALLFKLIKKYNEDICYRCKNPINAINELSIEHKIPWFGNSPDLFWDLDNVTFSHLSCNVAASNKPWARNTTAPANQLWCKGCKDYRSKEAFYISKSSKTGYLPKCKPCTISSADSYRRKTGKRPAEPKFLKGSKYSGI